MRDQHVWLQFYKEAENFREAEKRMIVVCAKVLMLKMSEYARMPAMVQ
jgi:hypothetical protein